MLPPELSADTPQAYRARVMINVLNAVVKAGRAGGSEESMVELQMALTGMCDAIAMLVAASGEDHTPKDRRDTADLCRRHVLTASNGIAAKLAAGEELPWTLQSLGETH
ncbi:hypothetical protein [Sphingomonas aerophila]|uniref:Uncharacterized protein n=1 Tax=Sphingomonas aerophila TaxID=1344948 RepID=A0A7W9BH23_9SPHN|nr:hypothetical protein [Sphingomonas aerophila]MBB5717057.1 hypothetical protein [Sphingomonas aerophila]